MRVKLLIVHHLEFLSLKEGCTGSSESTLVKMARCWKSNVTAHMCNVTIRIHLLLLSNMYAGQFELSVTLSY